MHIEKRRHKDQELSKYYDYKKLIIFHRAFMIFFPFRSEEQKLRNPYRWLPRKEEQQKEDKKASKKRSESPSQDEHIKHVTKDFCDWVASLGGESNNVEESTITSLFASGYETKPALSVPIHVVELTNVPPELRMSATVSQEETQTKTLEQVEKTQKQLVS